MAALQEIYSRFTFGRKFIPYEADGEISERLLRANK